MADQAKYEDAFVIATWHAQMHVELHFIIRKEDKPRPDYVPEPYPHKAYKWNSYHAARKYLREHEELKGYIIVNLRTIYEQRDAVEAFYSRHHEIITAKGIQGLFD
jgi:hypothetical protein